MIAWPDYFTSDYAGSAIRLATVAEAGTTHLLFACVELFPHEVPLPPALPPERRNLGSSRLVFGVTPMPLDQSLGWYEGALAGGLLVPGTSFGVTSPPLGPEPMLGRLVSPNDLPFAPPWHAGPRLHRLVPLADPTPPVAALAASDESTDRQRAARAWLAERVHFDVLAHDEWLAAAALLAPNPVSRAFRISIDRASAGGREVVRVRAPPRRGASTVTLFVRFREVRSEGSTAVEEVRLDPHGCAEVQFPEPVEQIVAELHCDRRGLLAVQGPYGFVRSIGGNLDVTSRAITVEVPSPRPGGKPTTYRKEVRSSETFAVHGSPVPEPAGRLVALADRRRRRTGKARPDAFWTKLGVDQALFYDDRDAAARFIRELVGRARRAVVFVDPFFDHVALRDFALAVTYRETSVTVLLGREHLRNAIPLPNGHAPPLGELLHAELDEIGRRSSTYGLPVPDLRLMGVECRKYHDRFLLLDDEVWHCGHSFNQVGRGEMSMMTRLRHPDPLRSAVLADLGRSERFEEAWREILTRASAEPAGHGWSALGTLLDVWGAWYTGWFQAWVGAPPRRDVPGPPKSNHEDGSP